ncbi:hypothetical protein NIES4072_07010 [Nostoc commune NIES-4072]|uniref:Uncharacterized protein n=1 Tax=Nostoc commune NIES-4072 TaxID=2005467 RepID=A0A2R5FEW8_NOSCO|nr:hypothetical protein NIES4070_19820 [Nostoc commune HK-02]GBG17052.1 hypothetical protein NIES4072_07010 [Nostoc commune NIES-4072]
MDKKSEIFGTLVLNKYKCINNLVRQSVTNSDNS